MTLQEIIKKYRHFVSQKADYARVCRQLDAYDSGNFWKHVKAKVPSHQMLVDTNYINYIKLNQLNSIYSSGYIADVIAKDYDDEELARKVNMFLQYVYESVDMQYYQLLAGERAALMNVGAVLIEWDSNAKDSITEEYNGQIKPRFIETASLYLDPAVRDYQQGSALFIAEVVSKSELVKNPEYREKLESIKKDNSASHDYGKSYIGSQQPSSEDEVIYLLNAFVKNEKGGIDQYIIANEEVILDKRENIKPDCFPVAVLYGLPAVKDVYGFNVTKLCLQNCLAINLLDSIGVTHVYAQQRRATLMRNDIGINVDYLAANINNPDVTIPVNGDPTKAIYQLDLPPLPNFLVEYRARLEDSIFLISGVDPTYTGRQTNSITTTGGMERLQQRASLTDAARIAMLERFTKQLTKLILDFYIEFGGEYKVDNHQTNEALRDLISINFKEIRANKKSFDFSMSASPFLPRNRIRYAQAATEIMNMQAQYQMNPPLITPEEWLQYQDFPQKDLMLQRMEAQRLQDDVNEITENVVNFSSLMQQGVTPDGAVQMLADEKAMMRANPKLGNVAAGSPQAKQQGI
jgi:hypothetical protein